MALAHAVLLGADPADGSLLRSAPREVTLIFSESAQPVGGGIVVVAPSGHRVEHGPITREGPALRVVVDAGERGTYVVLWEVESQDTHPSRGRLTFSVGKRSTPADVGGGSQIGVLLQALAHWLHFAGYAMGFGAVAFLLLVLLPLEPFAGEFGRRRPPAGGGPPLGAVSTVPVSTRTAPGPSDAVVEQRIWRLASSGVILLLLAEPLALVAQVTSLDPGSAFDPSLATDVLASSFGRVLAQRLAAALLLWALIGVARQARVGGWAILGLGLVLALVDGQAGHAVTSRPVALGLAANAVHVAAMGAWLGGLATLIAVWRLEPVQIERAAVLRRFGSLALISLALIAGSGAVMAVQHLSGFGDLLSTGFGQALSAKTIVLVAALVLVLAGRKVAHSSRWWRMELAALIVVLALAGLMVSLPPPV